MKEHLTADTPFFVDPNNGVDDLDRDGTEVDPWGTPQFAYNTVVERYYFNDRKVTLNIAAGTVQPASGVPCLITSKPWHGFGTLAIQGAGFNSTILSATGAACIQIVGPLVGDITVSDLAVSSTNSFGLVNGSSAFMTMGGVRFGSCVVHFGVNERRGRLRTHASCAISNNAETALEAESGSVEIVHSITVSSGLAFSRTFARARQGGLICCNAGVWSVSGSQTGKRFEVEPGSMIEVGGGGVDHFPGSIAGTVAKGGVYSSSTIIAP